MSTALLVPIHLDALHCPRERVVVPPSADFSRLPFFDGERDRNADVAQISEEIVARPFQDGTALLDPGVHLHWALPDALTRGRNRGSGPSGGAEFPAVPNRWLVRRTSGESPPRAWVVEGDYLHPDGTGRTAGVPVPVPPDPARGRFRPFRFLGRVLPVELWPERDPAAEYVPRLTAVGFATGDGGGYGDPLFAALYPNCHSVFGFHDGEIGTRLPTGLRYDVIGWYSDVAQDVLRDAVAGAATPVTAATRAAAVGEYAGWAVGDVPGEDFPARTAYYASASVTAPETTEAPGGGEPTAVVVGNTGGEALSAALAGRIDPDRAVGIADRLEEIDLAPRVEHRTVDADAVLHQLRHEKGFTPHPGPGSWTVRPVSTLPVTPPADADRSRRQAEVRLPDGLAVLLAALNRAQRDRDDVAIELEPARRQLFADWYRYLICAYPPPDSGDDYPDIDEARAFVRDVTLRRVVELAAALSPAPGTPAARLTEARTAVEAALAALNDGEALRAVHTRYELAPTVGPRFWRPTDPVVLLTGDEVRATDRHGRDGRLRDDGLLPCHVVDAATVQAVTGGDVGALAELVGKLRALDTAGGRGTVAFRDGDGRPWNPVRLDWQVEMFPLRGELGNVDPEADGYDPRFVTAHYELDDRGPDLVPAADRAITGAATVYSGSALLTGHAAERARRVLDDHLRRTVVPEYTGGTVPDDLATVIEPLRAWYERTHALSTPDARAADPVHCAIRAYQELSGLDCLAQSLGGFNDALLMHRQVAQLPIGDPLGFPEDRALADAVRDAVGTSNRTAPEPLDDFNPIRCGALRLLRLQLVDTFGQIRELDVGRAGTTEPLTTAGNPGLVTLPPRLSQPARVVFRWLAADLGGETNDHPGTTPVCGWILPDHLDTSLAVYDNAGRALGAIDQQGWQPSPGPTGVADPTVIGNPHLSRWVRDVVARGGSLSALMAALDGALESIEPEGSDQHVDLAVLVGRPMALVRAALDLELSGPPAVHLGWNQFRQDMSRSARDTDGLTRVAFPLRLGAGTRLDDGLVGYWLPDDPVFYSPQNQTYEHPDVRTWADGPLQIEHAIGDPSLVVRMLVDPRGKVHVTSGIQPVKTIGLPPALVAPALGRIEVAFRGTPLLTGGGRLDVPLPVEPGYQWAWLEADHDGWAETGTSPAVDRDVFTAALATRLWEHLIDPTVGWLRPLGDVDGRIQVVDAAHRAAATLGTGYDGTAAGVEEVLAASDSGLVERAATVDRLARRVAAGVWTALTGPSVGWLRPVPGGDRALVVPKDGRPRPVLSGDLLGAEPVLDSVLDLVEERLAPASTSATFGATAQLRGGWMTLRPEPAAD